MTGHLTHADYSLMQNAQRFAYDPVLDPIADAMERGDTDAWTRCHPVLQDQAAIYRDFRDSHRAALKAGLIPDDHGPNAA